MPEALRVLIVDDERTFPEIRAGIGSPGHLPEARMAKTPPPKSQLKPPKPRRSSKQRTQTARSAATPNV